MKLVACQPEETGTEAKAQMNRLLAIVSELISTLREENTLLRRGLPVSESLQSPRRRSLSEAYGKVWQEIQAQGLHQDQSVSKECDELFAAASELDGIARENARHLNASVQASQRRIEAIMKAVMDQERDNAPAYSANGNKQPTTASARKSMQV